ncbi:hypothetical protein Taro_035244 [Colocasia esculenta]|uniref:Uncharacterized protein n=1 Tax=Colocasia esculenta TaxID=4460 RepID=A0A843W368_COLES|nr:hypothetical protein [Colocasia esculenta]
MYVLAELAIVDEGGRGREDTPNTCKLSPNTKLQRSLVAHLHSIHLTPLCVRAPILSSAPYLLRSYSSLVQVLMPIEGSSPPYGPPAPAARLLSTDFFSSGVPGLGVVRRQMPVFVFMGCV